MALEPNGTIYTAFVLDYATDFVAFAAGNTPLGRVFGGISFGMSAYQLAFMGDVGAGASLGAGDLAERATAPTLGKVGGMRAGIVMGIITNEAVKGPSPLLPPQSNCSVMRARC